mmetsp:Transcript_32963/g.61761  ORF Transcript_32963/g.61761 Transcript_32963/m.61761 type:complete len:93 (+) Transcript_32963:814-1092(+)
MKMIMDLPARQLPERLPCPGDQVSFSLGAALELRQGRGRWRSMAQMLAWLKMLILAKGQGEAPEGSLAVGGRRKARVACASERTSVLPRASG